MDVSLHRRIFADVIFYILFSSLAYVMYVEKASGQIRIDFKSWKNLITFVFYAIFSSLHVMFKKISATKNCKIAGWQKRLWAMPVEPYILCKILSF